MGKKRKVYLHVGVTDGPGDFLEAALHEHQHSLAALGVQCPTRNADEMFRAAIEITRRHQAWDYRRREVEGAWAGICRRVLKAKGRDDVVISQPLLAVATPEQIDLLVDQLPGLAVHVVVVAERGPGSPSGSTEAAALLSRWERAVTKPERLHLLAVEPGATRAEVWKAYGDLVGFGTTSLSLAGLAQPVPASLDEALATVARLARRNESLQLRLAETERRRRLVKASRRRLTAASSRTLSGAARRRRRRCVR